MKVAFLTHEPFYPPSGGGSAEAIYLVEEFVQRGHQVHLFCPTIPEPALVEEKFKIQLHLFRTWQMGRYAKLRNPKYLLYPFFLQRMVERAAAAIPFDLIFSQHAIAAVTAGRLKQRLGLPVVMNFLDYLTGFMETWPAYLAPPPLLKQLEKFELSLPQRYAADGILTVSDTLADYFARTGYPRDRICPIYYGYDSKLFPFHSPSPSKTSAPLIVMHGSLDHHHLRDIALGAILRVTQSQPNALFRIVGQRTAALQQFLQRVAARQPKAAIETTGFIPYSEVAQALQGASVGIVPYEESTGTHCAFVAKIVEYLALGLPVVSTPLDSARRYFGSETRVRFSEFSGSSFGDKILSWLDEPVDRWTPAARAASDRVRENLDWRAISRKAVLFAEQLIL